MTKHCKLVVCMCALQFFTYLRDAFDQLYEEGLAGSPKMLSVGLHCRVVGRPGRARCVHRGRERLGGAAAAAAAALTLFGVRPASACRALARFLDYVKSKPKVWVARRVDIARHWMRHHPAPMRSKL